ncbi:MAG: glycerate kinase [Verrucomicrobiota bacterium]
MKILFVPDKFKGSMTAVQAAQAMEEGFRDVFPEAELVFAAVADGGEGMIEAFVEVIGGEIQKATVEDALGRKVEGEWLRTVIQGEKTAVIETSQACGLFRILENERQLMKSSTFGVGEFFEKVSSQGITKIIAGIGGSATNDMGTGMAEALGYRFLNQNNEELKAIPANFLSIDKIGPPREWKIPRVVVASDVVNPLLGERGATQVYGFQKGLKKDEVEPMERAHQYLVEIIRRDLGVDYSSREGAGAAGGLGYGLMTFCRAEMRSGFDLIAETTGLEEKIKSADLIVTGEGSLDSQTLEGKTAFGILRLANLYQKPVMAIAGRLADEEKLKTAFYAMTAIMEEGMTVDESKRYAYALTRKAAVRMAKQWKESRA